MKPRGTTLSAVLLAVLLGGLLAACGGGGEEGDDQAAASQTEVRSQGDDFTPVLAKVGDYEITQGYFDRRYEQLPPGLQAQFSGENWKERFLDELINEALLYQKAQDEEMDQDPDVQSRLEAARRSILVNAYGDWIKAHAEPTQAELEQYWALNKEKYKSLDRMLVYHIRCADKAKIDEAYAKLQKGEPWDRVAHEYDEDPNSQPNQGLIGWINPGGFVMGVGYSEDFTKTAFSLNRLAYSEPMQIEGQWHIIRAGSKVEGEQPTLEEVRDRVVEDVRPRVARRFYKSQLEELSQEYDVQRMGEFAPVTRTAEQLYRLAAEARNPYAKIDYYQMLVDQHPDSDYVDDALFMIGFLYSEELVEGPSAAVALQKLIDEHPDSDYVEDARWLLANLSRKQPGLRQAGVEDAADLQETIQGLRR